MPSLSSESQAKMDEQKERMDAPPPERNTIKKEMVLADNVTLHNSFKKEPESHPSTVREESTSKRESGKLSKIESQPATDLQGKNLKEDKHIKSASKIITKLDLNKKDSHSSISEPSTKSSERSSSELSHQETHDTTVSKQHSEKSDKILSPKSKSLSSPHGEKKSDHSILPPSPFKKVSNIHMELERSLDEGHGHAKRVDLTPKKSKRSAHDTDSESGTDEITLESKGERPSIKLEVEIPVEAPTQNVSTESDKLDAQFQNQSRISSLQGEQMTSESATADSPANEDHASPVEILTQGSTELKSMDTHGRSESIPIKVSRNSRTSRRSVVQIETETQPIPPRDEENADTDSQSVSPASNDEFEKERIRLRKETMKSLLVSADILPDSALNEDSQETREEEEEKPGKNHFKFLKFRCGKLVNPKTWTPSWEGYNKMETPKSWTPIDEWAPTKQVCRYQSKLCVWRHEPKPLSQHTDWNRGCLPKYYKRPITSSSWDI